MTEGQSEHRQKRHNRRVLLGIFGVPALVFALSTGLYYLVETGTLRLGTVNNGELVDPPLAFTELPLKTPVGSPYDYAQPEPKWTFLVMGDRRCQGQCERMLYIARQSIIALGKKMGHLRLAYLPLDGEVADSLQQRLDKQYQGIDVITTERQQLADLLAGADLTPGQPRTFYVIDPEGWLMMTYRPEDTDQATLNTLGKAVVRDMKRLLK